MIQRRKKLKLAVAAACTAGCSLEQIINLCPPSFALNSTPRIKTKSEQEEQEDDDHLNSLFLHNSALLSTLASITGTEPGWWVKPRKPAWFDSFLLEVHDRESWIRALRVSKPTFIWLCNQLQPLLNRQHTHFRAPIPVAWRLGAALFRLTTGADLQLIGERFGIGVSSAQCCVIDTVKAINQHFRSSIGFPRGDEMRKVVSGFYEKCELVNCAGAAGRMSLEVMASSGLDISGSLIVQGVCDSRYRFLDVRCGSSEAGKGADDPLLVGAGELLSEAGDDVGDLYLVGDESFPLLPWLLVGYEEDTEMPIMAESFNRRHSVGVMHARASFRVLRETFKVLSGCVKHSVGFVPGVVNACCVLHNVLVDRDEIPMRSFLQGMVSGEEEEEGVERFEGGFEDERGVELRDQLAEMFVRSDLFRD